MTIVIGRRSSRLYFVETLLYFTVYLTHTETQVHHSPATATVTATAATAATTIEVLFLQTNNDRLQKIYRSYVRNEFCELKREKKNRKNVLQMCAWPTLLNNIYAYT